MATVLNYGIYENLADNVAFFDKLRDFAVACGWTLSKEQRNKVWQYYISDYQWRPGTEDFMELKSTGYGSQNMIFRIRLRSDGSGDNEYMDIGGHRFDTYNNGSADNPVLRNGTEACWNYYGNANYFPTKMTSIPAVWFFGNNKIIFWVMKYNTTTCMCGFFGSMELFNISETQMFIVPFFFENSKQPWTYSSAANSLDGTGASQGVYYDNTYTRNNTRNILNFYFTDVNAVLTSFAPYGLAVSKNSFGEIRPAMRQIMYAQRSSNYFPAGYNWVVRLNTHGLSIGQKVKYDAEEYLVFPFKVQDTNNMGYGFRIK